LILMSILATAHSIGLDALRQARAQGDLTDQERMAMGVLRRDLQYDHFLEEDGKPNGGRKLSDQRTDRVTVNPLNAPTFTGYRPPRAGFFVAFSKPPLISNPGWVANNADTWNFYEGADPSGFTSSRAGSHGLHFTIVVPGGAPENTLTADVPFQNSPALGAYPITGRAAEVAYFLVPNGTTPGGVTKYLLIRRQRLCALNGDDQPAYQQLVNNAINAGAARTDPPEVMAVPGAGPATLFTLGDLTFGGNRMSRQPIVTHRIGEDVLLSNVTSLEIKFTGTQAPGVPVRYAPGTETAATTSVTWPRPFQHPSGVLLNTDYPYDYLPFDGNYDTFTADPRQQAATGVPWDSARNVAGSQAGADSSPLKRIRITGAMIRLRCWDQKTKQTRQTTVTVDL
ncbi:MAG: hypothetical protein K2V38_16945, partial [Gemmataceae bacterium]|nr:hypothetical protein [Gemmataceae bacterium]